MKARYFFAGSFIALVAAVGFLIYYQRTANGMAQQVEQADVTATSLADTAGAYTAAERYAQSHMGVSISLEMMGEYGRQLDQAQAGSGSRMNPQVYAAAQAACAKGDSVTQSKCISTYISSNSAPGTNPQPVVMPNQSDFVKAYHGASWTLDGTGVSLVVSMLAAAWGFVLLLHRPSGRSNDPHRHYRGPRPNVRL